MTAPAFTVVSTARTAAEADMLISALRGAGLHPVDLSTSPHFSLAGAEIPFRIEVPTSEAGEARELLSSSGSSSHNADDQGHT
jgi:hypothetical protein